jgi:glucose-1-phosphate adenylyltransferase
VVREGAFVTDSVIFADTVVEEGAQVSWSIVDSGCVIGSGATVGDPEARGTEDPDQVTLVGKDSQVADGATLEAGARLEPGTT